MSYREDILWTRLPEGFTREELHGGKVSFGDPALPGILGVAALQGPWEGWFEISVVHQSFDPSADAVTETILHQTSDRLFRIERQSSPDGAAFHLSFYTPSSSHLSNTRAAELRHSDPTSEV